MRIKYQFAGWLSTTRSTRTHSTRQSNLPRASKQHDSPQRNNHMTSLPFDNATPIQLLHLWDKRVINARTGEALFTLSHARRQTRFVTMKPVLVVTDATTNAQLCTIRVGRLRESSIRITMPDRKIKISNTRRKWEFTPTTVDSQGPWIWQKDRSGVLPSVVLKDSKDEDGKPLARISANLLSFPKMDLAPDVWTEIVVTAVALAEHVRCQRRHGGVMEISGGIMMSSDGGSGGCGGDGGGGCGGDGGGGGGGGGDGGS